MGPVAFRPGRPLDVGRRLRRLIRLGQNLRQLTSQDIRKHLGEFTRCARRDARERLVADERAQDMAGPCARRGVVDGADQPGLADQLDQIRAQRRLPGVARAEAVDGATSSRAGAVSDQRRTGATARRNRYSTPRAASATSARSRRDSSSATRRDRQPPPARPLSWVLSLLTSCFRSTCAIIFPLFSHDSSLTDGSRIAVRQQPVTH